MNDKKLQPGTPIDLFMILISKKMRYVFLFVLLFMWINSSYKKAAKKAVISSLFSLIINRLIKSVYFKPRPFMKRRIGILIPSKTDSSFPSKHTLLVFSISTSVFLYERFIGSIMWGLSMLTGFSRIWLGHHYPIDIIGSAFIGSFVSILTDKTFRFLKSKDLA
ncbi:undecaprenyl-diphosphatase [Metabacillus arenae]|uniref:Undecaprenyl-diphosphatase n=1 Tax=Metabacillus arenae TaxID=2771434 RepID=A0A926RWD3_9BACI|nr:undecaprenyl-diphosphatase [Metabacillus arenae]MBD1380658.1 undecaprenyl-diphosphatase [Metabacillus arenae]